MAAAKEEKEKEAAAVLLLKTLEDMLHNNRITEKKKEIYKNQSIADTETLWTQIGTLQWILSESLSIRTRLRHERYYY